MKTKLFAVVFIICTVFSLTGCLFGLFKEKYNEKNIAVDTDGQVYLLKTNFDKIALNGARTEVKDIIEAKNTGWVIGTREAEDEENVEKIPDLSSLAENIKNDTSVIDSLNIKITKLAQEAESNMRASKPKASDFEIIKSTTLIDNTNPDPDDKTNYKIWLIENITVSNGMEAQAFNEENGHLMYNGKHCNIWMINNNKKVIDASTLDYDALGKKFDSIYELETTWFGNHIYNECKDMYINPQKKIDIIAADLFYDAKIDQKSGTYGYFATEDHYKKAYANYIADSYSDQLKKILFDDEGNPDYETIQRLMPRSNERQCIYIDTYFYSKEPKAIYSTLVHEFNHLLNYCTKTISQDLTIMDENTVWYTEMLSMVAEDFFQNYLGIDDESSPKYRLAWFDNGYNLGFTLPGMFQNYEDYNGNSIVYFAYSNTYAFGAMLARNCGGLELINDIATNNKSGKASITAALQNKNATKEYGTEGHTYKITTFDDALDNMYKLILNYNTATQGAAGYIDYDNDSRYKKIITLERSYSTELEPQLYLTPARSYFKKTDKYGNITNEIKPVIFKSNKDGRVDLYPNGFSIHYVGQGISQISFAEPQNGCEFKYYLIY